jgi:glycosyltransferase involved in cell wall biosynthesis
VLAPFSAIRPLVQLLEAEPGVLGERSLVYDADDDLFAADLSVGDEDILERDLVDRILKLADLVTVATPVLARRLRSRTSAEIRVIRNALDPAWYAGAIPEPGLAGTPRVLYHGVAARLRDYAVARPSLDLLAAEMPSLRRVWLGSEAPEIAAVVDETRSWVAGASAFAASLVAARPDIGIAPVRDTPYDRARSELHWLEYAMAGAPAIVSGFDGPGPYDVVRDGVDGLVARTPMDWERHLRALARSPQLRADIAGTARDRVLADYMVSARAAEWSDAYSWAVDHSGIGRGGHDAG